MIGQRYRDGYVRAGSDIGADMSDRAVIWRSQKDLDAR